MSFLIFIGHLFIGALFSSLVIFLVDITIDLIFFLKDIQKERDIQKTVKDSTTTDSTSLITTITTQML